MNRKDLQLRRLLREKSDRRDYWADRLNLNRRQRRGMSMEFMDQLERCRDDAARLLLLRVGRWNRA